MAIISASTVAEVRRGAWIKESVAIRPSTPKTRVEAGLSTLRSGPISEGASSRAAMLITISVAIVPGMPRKAMLDAASSAARAQAAPRISRVRLPPSLNLWKRPFASASTGWSLAAALAGKKAAATAVTSPRMTPTTRTKDRMTRTGAVCVVP